MNRFLISVPMRSYEWFAQSDGLAWVGLCFGEVYRYFSMCQSLLLASSSFTLFRCHGCRVFA